MSMFLLQPPSASWKVTTLVAMRIASALMYQSAVWLGVRYIPKALRPCGAGFDSVTFAAFISAWRVSLSAAFCFSERARYSRQALCWLRGSLAMRAGVTDCAMTFVPMTVAAAGFAHSAQAASETKISDNIFIYTTSWR